MKEFFNEAFDRQTLIQGARIAGFVVVFFGTIGLIGMVTAPRK